MIYLIVNIFFILIALIGVFLIDKLDEDEGFFIGMNDCMKIYFLIELSLIALCTNIAIFIMDFIG